ncbi:hypothetical protein NIES2135_29300 [Leptolyngbya boryana NIES-2135]|jgi:hypothetical protein|uniref:HNH domain-containing protein n=1 Tax=Leptolyngbya boryana NIES-2135 TaxID=1973484 RepID=A0A1Z4JH98_LEPBY|nr:MULTISPECIES: HNH endonuclease [Leptolyngbya]BAY56100.1 hypothetical protein NIES2135_29300 [Leptolyngbya boryana NIES-2135]MBD2366211.1 HNH endonuclease [Leptolyngbya sp. FACHB-161]MBD2372391.1 HNH endonuclease [Leptolyngbya sp. FACHB-238]MBD2396814.1 HNH endonuclease [Leptolyngbya sp. FACHB-239]MBD2403337.1 HNH endonuclease [Leptolyngbya sp. FACHB-402]
MNLDDKSLEELFKLAAVVGNKRYHKLTAQDFEDYRKYDYWRYVNGDSECGTTLESQTWVKEHSDRDCPICDQKYSFKSGRTIDHKLPRAQYPWLSMDFRNFWVICQQCNREKAEMNWYEYEHYIYVNYLDRYSVIRDARPRELLRSLKQS